MDDDKTKEIVMGNQFEVSFMVSAESPERALSNAQAAIGHWLPLSVRSVRPVPMDRTAYSYQVGSVDGESGDRMEVMIAFDPGSKDPAVIVMLRECGEFGVEEVGRVKLTPGELAVMVRSLGWWPLEQMEQMQRARGAVAGGLMAASGRVAGGVEGSGHVCKYEEAEGGGARVVCQCGWRSMVIAGEQGLYTVGMVHRLAHEGF